MAWRRIGDRPFSEPMLVRIIDAYMRHYGEIGLNPEMTAGICGGDFENCNFQLWFSEEYLVFKTFPFRVKFAGRLCYVVADATVKSQWYGHRNAQSSWFYLSDIETALEVLQLFSHSMGLLPDTKNCGLRMRRECREFKWSL